MNTEIFLTYSCIFSTSHCIRRHAKLLSETCLYYKTYHTILSKTRLEYRTQQLSIDVTMTSFYYFEVTMEGLSSGWKCRHGKLFTQRPGWNKRILRKIQCVLIKSPVTCIQDQRVLGTNKKDNLWLLNCNTVYIGFCDYGYSGKSGFSDR